MHPFWTYSIEGGPQRVNHSAVIINKDIYMFGGFCSGEDYNTDDDDTDWTAIDIYAFNTEFLRWRRIQQRNEYFENVPYMRYGHTSVAIDEKAYLFGGRSDLCGASNILYYFDTGNFCWHTPKVCGHLPGARDGHGMCVARGNIYIFGGYEAEVEQFSEETMMLDMRTLTWSLLQTQGQTGLWRDFHTLTAYGDKIYLFGGRGDDSDNSISQPYDNDIKVLDLNTLEWSAAAHANQKLPVGRRSHTAFIHEDSIYIFGGFNSKLNEHYNDLWKFDMKSGLWKEISVHGVGPCPRRRHCCCYKDNKAYIFGGTSPTPTSHSNQDLIDQSDTHVLDLEPNLKVFCLSVVRELFRKCYNLDLSCLPVELEYLVKLRNSGITAIRNNNKG
ncbi:kelch domain-containing protein 3-like [Styela clava]